MPHLDSIYLLSPHLKCICLHLRPLIALLGAMELNKIGNFEKKQNQAAPVSSQGNKDLKNFRFVFLLGSCGMQKAELEGAGQPLHAGSCLCFLPWLYPVRIEREGVWREGREGERWRYRERREQEEKRKRQESIEGDIEKRQGKRREKKDEESREDMERKREAWRDSFSNL